VRLSSGSGRCNNAGVASGADPWFGPLSAWEWVVGVNLWGVIHGMRAFLPILINQGEGHIVNTASTAGLNPGSGPVYAATKHAVVALSEELFKTTKIVDLPVGVSVLCPGWVHTAIMDADRNWPERLGEMPVRAPASEVMRPHFQRAIDDGMGPDAIADLVADAIMTGKFWILPHPEFVAPLAPHRRRRKSRYGGRRAWIPTHRAMDERDSVRTDGADRLGAGSSSARSSR